MVWIQEVLNYTPGDEFDPTDEKDRKLLWFVVFPFVVVVTPLDTFQLLFFALFGLTQPADLRMETAQPEWTLFFYKTVFGFYMLVTTVVLINMLIAMMSDTYQRIQVYEIFVIL